MSERRSRIHTSYPLPKSRRRELLDVARPAANYQPDPVSEQDLRLMRLIEMYLHPHFTAAVTSVTR